MGAQLPGEESKSSQGAERVTCANIIYFIRNSVELGKFEFRAYVLAVMASAAKDTAKAVTTSVNSKLQCEGD
jgi:hypothetical protein